MLKLHHTYIYLPVLLFLWLGLYIDSIAVSVRFEHSQWITTLLALPVFMWVYLKSSKVVKQLMLFGLIVALLGELFFSLLLEMYTYRLHNVPLYVPLGHSMIYAGVYYMTKEPWVKQHQVLLTKVLYYLIIIYSTLWLLFAQDTFGFLCMVAIVILLRFYKTTKLFFLIMFFMVVYLELLGTHYGCWSWPTVWFDRIDMISSANPPSAISVFYFGFDAGCLWLYKHYNSVRWQRFRRMRTMRKTK